jgi:hypothetical protein
VRPEISVEEVYYGTVGWEGVGLKVEPRSQLILGMNWLKRGSEALMNLNSLEHVVAIGELLSAKQKHSLDQRISTPFYSSSTAT